ncbi:MAG: ATP-binding protein [Wenzhouxiangella sp.]|nr:ATP-binding protein [Wenzhouxiangella sp.]
MRSRCPSSGSCRSRPRSSSATGAWIRASETLLIQGPPGVGKTHIAVGLGVKAIEQGFSAQFYRFDELLTALKADADLAPARLRRKKYLNTALLIIDELGFEPMDRAEASLFFRLVTYRYGRGSILITTNKSVRDWSELLAGDEALTAAILDRLLHNAHVINIKGRSYRLRDLEQTLGARQGRAKEAQSILENFTPWVRKGRCRLNA